MAVASRHLCRTLLRSTTRPTQRRKYVSQLQGRINIPKRCFSSTPSTSAKDEESLPTLSDLVSQVEENPTKAEKSSKKAPEAAAAPQQPTESQSQPATHPSQITSENDTSDSSSQHKFAKYMTEEGIQRIERIPQPMREELERALGPYFEHIRKNPPDVWANEADEGKPYYEIEEFDADEMLERNDIEDDLDMDAADAKGIRNGYWADEEPDDTFALPDDDDTWHEEDITTPAEAELEVHREVRDYTRKAAWDLPLLLKYARPFKEPDMTKTPLRFRYTTYMGEEHPAQNKVVLQFTTKEVGACAKLTEVQRSKFIKLLGVRYNPDTDMVHMSCEKFGGQAQNKRYLGDQVKKLLEESKTGDMFEDVPFDFRHHKPKVTHDFPEAWKVSGEAGVQRMLEARGQTLLLDGQRPVDGKRLMETHARVRVAAKSAAAVTR